MSIICFLRFMTFFLFVDWGVSCGGDQPKPKQRYAGKDKK